MLQVRAGVRIVGKLRVSEPYPSKPIRMIVGGLPGNGADAVAQFDT